MELSECDLSDSISIETYAKQLEGKTFREVLEMGIVPEGVDREYNSKRYKGGMGTLIEERFFGYKANNEQEADFPQAGVELKATCFDVKRDGNYSAGERLVLTMIPFDRPIEDDFFSSHVWNKSACILLIYYERNKLRDSYDQVIRFVKLFTPSNEDLKIISSDYDKIADIIRAGLAETLSESLTAYLGACTKGATAASSWVPQYYPPHSMAKRRAFCFKRSYMDYVLHAYVIGDIAPAEPIIKDPEILDHTSFEDHVLSLIEREIGMSDEELCEKLGLDYKGNKAQWNQIVYSLLGVNDDRAEEFEKANISVRTVRIEKNGRIKESLSLDTFRFRDIAVQSWEESNLKDYFEETRFLFVAFQRTHKGLELASARFWSMPMEDIEGDLRECWIRTRDTIRKGVELTIEVEDDGSVRIFNDLPKKGEAGSIAHVRPHANRRGYLFEDGTSYGDPEKNGDELPDGRIMTKQSFWLNNDYVYGIVSMDEDDA